MIKTDPGNLYDEVKHAADLRDKFLENTAKLVERYHGAYYRSDRMPAVPIVENHAYQFVAIVLPSLIFDNPKCRVITTSPKNISDEGVAKLQTAMRIAGTSDLNELAMMFGVPDPKSLMKELGIETMSDVARGLEIALNRWSEDNEVASPLSDIAMDFLFSYGVGMVVEDSKPGHQGSDLAPTQPYLVQIAPHHFLMDSAARTNDPMQAGGPRFMGHLWRADHEDLMNDPDYNREEVERLAVDTDFDKWEERHYRSMDIPRRREILAWDIWVPEVHQTDQPGFNGSIFTLAVSATPDGVSKKALWIREPRPAYCPPWGPYTVFGAYKVPGSPYPLSPLAAVAEQAEAVNAHEAAAARDAASYKRFVAGPITSGDGDRIRSVQHGEYIGLDDAAGKLQQIELGGVSGAQYQYNQYARDKLRSDAGVSGAMLGDTEKGVTATRDAVGQQAAEVRMGGLKRVYARCVAKVFKTAAWYAFHSDSQIHPLGPDGERHGLETFTGGKHTGPGGFSFFDLSIRIDPMSMEHTNQSVYQRRVNAAFQMFVQAAERMPNMPHVNWREPLRVIYESLNIPDADEWVDYNMLERMKQMGVPGQEAAGMGSMPAAPDSGEVAMPGSSFRGGTVMRQNAGTSGYEASGIQ